MSRSDREVPCAGEKETMTDHELSGLTDEELVSLYREGNQEAAAYLIRKYKPLVLRISGARFLAGGDHDDLIQEGMIGLFKALRDYDSGREASFLTFASLCIDRQMLSAIEAAGRGKNRPLNDAVYLGEEELECAEKQFRESPEKIVIDREGADERIRLLRTKLSSFEKKVLDLYLTGMDYHEIADVLGKPPKSVDNALQRIRKKSG